MRMPAVVTAASAGAGAGARAPGLLPAPAGSLPRTRRGRRRRAPGPPNVVVVLTDDMREDDLAYAPFLRTVLRQGRLHFRNSFSNNPMCCPARASILTGQQSHNHHVVTVEPPWGFGAFDDSVTVATALKAAGYQTGYVGKYLNGYGIQRSKVTGQDSGRYVPAGWDHWRGEPGRQLSAGVPGGTYKYFDTTLNVDGRIVRNKGVYSTNLIFDRSRALVDTFHQKDQPFFLYVNPVAPHFGGPREPDDPPILTQFTPAQSARGSRAASTTCCEVPRGPEVRRLPRARRVRQDLADPVPAGPRPGRHRAVRELARQRAEAVFVVDREFKKLVGDAQGQRRVRRHGHRVQLRQRPLPGRAPQADRQAAPLRAVVPGADAGPGAGWRGPATGSAR